MTRDLQGKDPAWYRFQETPGKVYGPRDMAFVWRTYGLRQSCEVACAGVDGQPVEPWFPATTLRARLKSQAVQPKQLTRLRELGVPFDEATIDRIAATELLEVAELQLPPTEGEIAEAAALGVRVQVGMTRAQLNRAVQPKLEQLAEEEDRQQRIALNADWVARIRAAGVSVADDVEEEELYRLMALAEERESLEEEAAADFDDDAPRSRRRKTAPAHSADTKRRCVELAQELHEDFLVKVLQLKRRPSKKLMTKLYDGLQVQIAARPDFGGNDAKVWFLTEAAKALDIALTIDDRTGKPPAPTAAIATRSLWRRWAIIGIVLFALVRLCGG